MSCTFFGALLVVGIIVFVLWSNGKIFGDSLQLGPDEPMQYQFVIPDNLTDGKCVYFL